MKKKRFRIEKDYLGKKKIPFNEYYGIQTERALENFPISNLHLQKSLIYSIAKVKKAAAITNIKSKALDKKIGNAIVKACENILRGKLDREFNVDVFQAGAGTSENMNLNEVIANKALEILHKKKGSYNIINPNDHVNLSQSTNDVFHSSIHIAAYSEIEELLINLENLEKELKNKSILWKNVIKSGRTHLRDAVPMTLGEEFSGYSSLIRKDSEHIKDASKQLLEINIGGTAIGTKVNTNKFYQENILKEINKLTKLKFTHSKNFFEGSSSLDAIVLTSSSLKVLSVNLIKIANDLRLLSSGPITGFNEIIIPAVQPGSSIMPAKVNPAILEMMDMICFQVIGNDTVIELCGQEGQLELNVMMPLAAYSLINSIQILTKGIYVFTEKCVKGIKANEKKCLEYFEKNPIIVTALTPYIGYNKAAELAKKAYKQGRSIKEIVLERKLLNKNELERIFSLHNLIK